MSSVRISQSVERKSLIVYERREASPVEFVAFWRRFYLDEKYPDAIYSEAIKGPLSPERIRQLFQWKNGGKLSVLKNKSIEQNYIRRLFTLDTLTPEFTPEKFFALFPKGGAIWRIFWLHCCRPARFPIYDQHVHRAMTFIKTGNPEELDEKSDQEKIRLYIETYLPFHGQFAGLNQREVDRAVWAFGKFLKTYQTRD
jgi:hypothetical protein